MGPEAIIPFLIVGILAAFMIMKHKKDAENEEKRIREEEQIAQIRRIQTERISIAEHILDSAKGYIEQEQLLLVMDEGSYYQAYGTEVTLTIYLDSADEEDTGIALHGPQFISYVKDLAGLTGSVKVDIIIEGKPVLDDEEFTV